MPQMNQNQPQMQSKMPLQTPPQQQPQVGVPGLKPNPNQPNNLNQMVPVTQPNQQQVQQNQVYNNN